MVKYSFWVQKILHYTIQHEGGRHIDFRECLYLRPGQITANNCKTAFSLGPYMSSRALATTTTSSLYRFTFLSGSSTDTACVCRFELLTITRLL